MTGMRDRAAIIGAGTSPFVAKTPASPMRLAAQAFKAALADAGLGKDVPPPQEAVGTGSE